MNLSRRRFLKLAGASGAGFGLSGLSTYVYGTRLETEWIDEQRISIPIRNLPSRLEGFRIVLLSDFHLYPHTRLEYIQKVIALANRMKPHLVALTGDFVQKTAEAMFDLGPALSKLDPELGTFSVLGNHDHWKGADIVANELIRHDLGWLNNSGRMISWNGAEFFLAGVDDAWSGNPDLGQAMSEYSGDCPVILLAHEPDPADAYSKDPRISLQLSGHSHGGQVRFPGFGSPFLPPFGRKYDVGLYRVRDMWLYTNRGLGVTVPIRFNCRPEITEVTLIRESS
jgi:predicted MPP superfamily phosphohydrolase